LNRFKHEVKQFEQTGELDQDLYEALFDYYSDAGEIPYGIAKARDGDPMEWVAKNLESHLSGGGIVGGNPDKDYGIERESVEHGDYAEEKSRIRELAGLPPEETDEGIIGGLAGGAGGAALGGSLFGLPGAIGGGLLGAIAGDNITDEAEETNEGELGTAIGAGLGGTVGGIPGATLGGIAGHYLSNDKETNEGSLKDIDWKEVAGSTAGGTAGYMAGSAIGGPIAGLAAAGLGSVVGGALAKDDQKTTEAVRGALAGGALGGAATRSVKGAMAGAKLGSAIQDRFAAKQETNESDADLFDDAVCNMTEAGENCSVHGMEECYGADTSPLAGQYGHSGKMKPVDKDLSFLDRLKELSGIKK